MPPRTVFLTLNGAARHASIRCKVGKAVGRVNGNYYILANNLTAEEIAVVQSIIGHIEKGSGKVGIQRIARQNNVSPTFIMKLCKRLGFDGYSELYYYLAMNRTAIAPAKSAIGLPMLVDNYDAKQVKAFGALLAKYHDRKMFVVGEGFADLVADYIVQRLAVCGFMVFNRVHFFDLMMFRPDADSHMETNIEPSLIIAISQSGETGTIVNDVSLARQHSFEVVCFTRRADSTLAAASDIAFIVDASKQALLSGVPNPFFGKVILAFEEMMGSYYQQPAAGSGAVR